MNEYCCESVKPVYGVQKTWSRAPGTGTPIGTNFPSNNQTSANRGYQTQSNYYGSNFYQPNPLASAQQYYQPPTQSQMRAQEEVNYFTESNFGSEAPSNQVAPGLASNFSNYQSDQGNFQQPEQPIEQGTDYPEMTSSQRSSKPRSQRVTQTNPLVSEYQTSSPNPPADDLFRQQLEYNIFSETEATPAPPANFAPAIIPAPDRLSQAYPTLDTSPAPLDASAAPLEELNFQPPIQSQEPSPYNPYNPCPSPCLIQNPTQPPTFLQAPPTPFMQQASGNMQNLQNLENKRKEELLQSKLATWKIVQMDTDAPSREQNLDEQATHLRNQKVNEYFKKLNFMFNNCYFEQYLGFKLTLFQDASSQDFYSGYFFLSLEAQDALKVKDEMLPVRVPVDELIFKNLYKTVKEFYLKSGKEKIIVASPEWPIDEISFDSFLCSLCFVTENETMLPCGHCFCQKCLREWGRKDCPTCRTPFKTDTAYRLCKDVLPAKQAAKRAKEEKQALMMHFAQWVVQ